MVFLAQEGKWAYRYDLLPSLADSGEDTLIEFCTLLRALRAVRIEGSAPSPL
jgi:hypothetical protein